MAFILLLLGDFLHLKNFLSIGVESARFGIGVVLADKMLFKLLAIISIFFGFIPLSPSVVEVGKGVVTPKSPGSVLTLNSNFKSLSSCIAHCVSS